MSVNQTRESRSLDHLIDQAIDQYTYEPVTTISLNDAMTLGRLAQEQAHQLGVAIVFSLLDSTGYQRYFFSMDNALLVSHQLAYRKAWSAVALKMPTHELASLCQPGQSLYGLLNHPDICCVGGGLPCWHKGQLLGAIGISGGSVEQDMSVASNTLFKFSQSRYLLTSSPLAV